MALARMKLRFDIWIDFGISTRQSLVDFDFECRLGRIVIEHHDNYLGNGQSRSSRLAFAFSSESR